MTISKNMRIDQFVVPPSPAIFSDFLLASGWTSKSTDSRWASFENENNIRIDIPLLENAPDYSIAVAQVISELSDFLEIHPSALLRNILAEGKDLIRVRIKSANTRDGQLNVEVGKDVFQGVHKLLSAVGASLFNPRAVHSSRRSAGVSKLLRNTKFGLPEIGSYVVVIENPLPPSFNTQQELELDGELTLPDERRLSLKFFDSIAALEGAIRLSQITKDLAPFTDNINAGISANLCEAITQIIDGTEAEEIEIGSTFSARWPSPRLHSSSSKIITSAAVPVLKEASKRMRENVEYGTTTLKGPVVQLQSEDSTCGGTFAIIWHSENVTRKIWVEVGEKDYKNVIRAHRDGHLVKLTGELKRRQKWTLANPRELGVIALR